MLLMSLGVFESRVFESQKWSPQRLKDSKTQRWVITGVKCIPRLNHFNPQSAIRKNFGLTIARCFLLCYLDFPAVSHEKLVAAPRFSLSNSSNDGFVREPVPGFRPCAVNSLSKASSTRFADIRECTLRSGLITP
jgi:hypothetical protein